MHKKRKLILCVPKMQIALVSIQRKIKFNVGPCDFAPTHFNLVPSFPGYEIVELLIFIYCFLIFVFFWFKLKKTTPLQEDNFSHASGVSSHYIVLHPVSSRASRTSGILVQFIRHACLLSAITISDSILAIHVTLDRSKRTFAFYIDLDTSTSLHDGRNRKYITTMF